MNADLASWEEEIEEEVLSGLTRQMAENATAVVSAEPSTGARMASSSLLEGCAQGPAQHMRHGRAVPLPSYLRRCPLLAEGHPVLCRARGHGLCSRGPRTVDEGR